jgi:hypothetical protein
MKGRKRGEKVGEQLQLTAEETNEGMKGRKREKRWESMYKIT